MSSKEASIPLCRSEFLQDVTIALGRRSLKGLRYHSSLEFAVSEETVDGMVHERLDIERHDTRGLTKIVLWEDGLSWVDFREEQQGPGKVLPFQAHVSLKTMDSDEIASLIRATLTDFASVRKFWQEHATAS